MDSWKIVFGEFTYVVVHGEGMTRIVVEKSSPCYMSLEIPADWAKTRIFQFIEDLHKLL